MIGTCVKICIALRWKILDVSKIAKKLNGMHEAIIIYIHIVHMLIIKLKMNNRRFVHVLYGQFSVLMVEKVIYKLALYMHTSGYWLPAHYYAGGAVLWNQFLSYSGYIWVECIFYLRF